MTTPGRPLAGGALSRPLRADAARNAGRIIAAALAVFAEHGPGASLDQVARRAGIGPATLYRRFGTRDDLVRSCLEQILHERVEPALADALVAVDPWDGLQRALLVVLETADRSRDLVAAASHPAAVLEAIRPPVYQALGVALLRARNQGLVRPDLTEDDLPLLVAMVVATMGPAPDGWRRYFRFLMAGLRPSPA